MSQKSIQLDSDIKCADQHKVVFQLFWIWYKDKRRPLHWARISTYAGGGHATNTNTLSRLETPFPRGGNGVWLCWWNIRKKNEKRNIWSRLSAKIAKKSTKALLRKLVETFVSSVTMESEHHIKNHVNRE